MVPQQSTTAVENWKPVVGYEERYEVSDRGNVRWKSRVITCVNNGTLCNRAHHGRGLAATISHGYRYVMLSRGYGRRRRIKVSVLVAEAFIGPRPTNFHCCHNDSVKTNDAVDNLRWDTFAANLKDKKDHCHKTGKPFGPRGEQVHGAKLSEADIRAIRTLAVGGVVFQHEIARRFGITQGAVCNIVNRKSWKHIA